MQAMPVLILNANASRAQLYHSTNLRTTPLQELKTAIHENSRKKIRDLICDRLSGARSSLNRIISRFGGQSSNEKKASPREHEEEVFATQLIDLVKQAKLQHPGCDHLIVIASPHFEGLLRQRIQEHLYKQFKVINYLTKDYTLLKPIKLFKILQEEYGK